MSAAAGLVGWTAALVALLAAWLVQRSVSQRLELVARACHEVRGPLAAARLGVEALGGAAPRPAARRMTAIDLELRRAGLALDDIDAARAGRRARERREAVEVAELLSDAAAAWRPVARAFGAELRVHGPVATSWVRGDRLRLAQACGNLLANAIEHGGGVVELRARPAGRRIRIEVCDRGPGLPATVGSLTARPRGGRGRRGRGLAITEEIARRHGGRLSAAPSSTGARLALELPLVGGGR